MCGTPWERQVERTPMGKALSARKSALGDKGATCCSGAMTSPPRSKTVGWEPGCDCDAGELDRCVVLDPFAGSGTTGVVCANLGREFIGIELNPDYAEMAARRIAAASAQGDLFR